MRTTTALSACATVALLACTSENGPTEPEASGTMAPADPTVAAVVDIWRERAPHTFGPLIGVSVGVLTSSAGQSVVYGFGGCDVVNSDFGHCTVCQISIYNVATDTWTCDRSFLGIRAQLQWSWRDRGQAVLLGGLYPTQRHRWLVPPDMGLRSGSDPAGVGSVTQLADMPKPTAEGVTGVINGKLYVLPGICDEESRATDPSAGSTATIRRRTGGDHGDRRPTSTGRPRAASSAASSTWQEASAARLSMSTIRQPTTGRPGLRYRKPAGPSGPRWMANCTSSSGTDAYVYDPGTNRWSAIADPTWAHDGVVRVVINGKPKLLAVGGLSVEAPNNTEVYTP